MDSEPEVVKLSEYIAMLQDILNKHGDLDIYSLETPKPKVVQAGFGSPLRVRLD